MDNLGFLGLAYGFAWIAITLYLLTLVRRQRQIEKRLDELNAPRGQEDPKA